MPLKVFCEAKIFYKFCLFFIALIINLIDQIDQILHYSSNPKPWDSALSKIQRPRPSAESTPTQTKENGDSVSNFSHAGCNSTISPASTSKKGDLEMIWWDFYVRSKVAGPVSEFTRSYLTRGSD